MAWFSQRARSGKDPEFTKEWMKQVMSFQVAKVKGSAAVGAAAVAASKGDTKALLAAAEVVDGMDESGLMELAGLDAVEEGDDES